MRRLAHTVAQWWWPAMVLVGLPIGLLHTPGRPAIPRHLPTHNQVAQVVDAPLTRPAAITGFVLLGWLLWAVLACAVLTVIYRRVVWWCRRLPRMRLPGPLQSLSAAILGAIAVSGASTAASAAPPAAHVGLAHTEPGQRPPDTSTTHTPPSTTAGRPPAPNAPAAASPAAHASNQSTSYTVRRADTLWSIAQQQLGNPTRWPEIYHLNQSRFDQHGRMHHGDHIEPGWVLTMPHDAATLHTAPPPAPPQTRTTPLTSPTMPSPVTTPAAPVTTPPPAPTHSPAPAATVSPRQAPTQHTGVHLTDGSWVTVGLAASLTGAASMVWLKRRRRYTPRPPTGSAGQDTDLRPLPPAISQLRRGLRDQATGPLPPPNDQPTTLATDDRPATDPLPPIGPSGPQLSGLPDPLPATGLGLAGDGAPAAARALLVATLSAGSPDDPDARGQLITTTDTLTLLLGAHAEQIRPMPRLTVTDDPTDALTHIEELLIARRRLLDDYDTYDLAGMRTKDLFHPPMPPVLLLTPPPPPHLTTRLSNTLRLGAPLQISAAILGPWPPGDTHTIDPHGRPATSRTSRLAVLDVPTTLQLLTVLHEAHTGQPTIDNEPVNSDADDEPPVDESPATKPTPPPERRTTPSTDSENVTPPAISRRHQHRARVALRLLGEPAILDRDNQPVTGLRHHARELLVYLAVHRHGADLPDIMEAFWPTATLRRAAQRLSTETGNLRRCIRTAAADASIQPVINSGGRYHLNPDVLDIDIWRIADALQRAATDPDHQADALREVITTHTGTLAEGYDYDWIDQHRHHLTRQGIQARLQLAQLLTPTQPHTAADLAQAAADLDPLNEDAAQHAIRALAAIGDTTGVHARLRLLREALDAIDEQPSAETLALAAHLHHPGHSSDSPPTVPHDAQPADDPVDPPPSDNDGQEG